MLGRGVHDSGTGDGGEDGPIPVLEGKKAD